MDYAGLGGFFRPSARITPQPMVPTLGGQIRSMFGGGGPAMPRGGFGHPMLGMPNVGGIAGAVRAVMPEPRRPSVNWGMR